MVVGEGQNELLRGKFREPAVAIVGQEFAGYIISQIFAGSVRHRSMSNLTIAYTNNPLAQAYTRAIPAEVAAGTIPSLIALRNSSSKAASRMGGVSIFDLQTGQLRRPALTKWWMQA